MGMGHLERLRRIRALLVTQGRLGAQSAKLACYSGAGFSAELRGVAAQDTGIVLVGLDDLYRRS